MRARWIGRTWTHCRDGSKGRASCSTRGVSVKHDSNCSDNIHLRCRTGHIGGKGYTPIVTRCPNEPGYGECERSFWRETRPTSCREARLTFSMRRYQQRHRSSDEGLTSRRVVVYYSGLVLLRIEYDEVASSNIIPNLFILSRLNPNSIRRSKDYRSFEVV